MIGALGRYLRAFGYLITGRIDSARRALSENPYVVQATFDQVIQEKTRRIQQYKDAISGMVAQEEKKKAQLHQLSEEVAKLKRQKDGAAAMAKRLVEKHNGNADAVKADPEYQRCQAAFRDFSSTLAEKEARCAEIEGDIKQLEGTLSNHKIQITSLMRELEKVKEEKHATVADIITAKEQREVADMISGISEDRTAKELQELRDIRHQARANARVSQELSGLDTKRAEQEFLHYAEQSQSDSEFDSLIGLGNKQAEPPAGERPRLNEG